MVDRCNRLLIIGQNDLLKHYLEKYFLSKDYQLIQSINEHKSFIPIIILPFNEELGTDADVTLLALNKMKRNQKTYLPELAFFIRPKSNYSIEVIRKHENLLKKKCEAVVSMEVCNNMNQSSLKELASMIGKKIEHFKEYPPQSRHIKTVVSRQKGKPRVGVVGLGYVGLPVAIHFAEKYDVIGFDIDEDKINTLKQNTDPTKQFSRSQLKETTIEFVSDDEKLIECDYIFVAVPTPITNEKKPDLSYLKHASTLIGNHLTPGTIVVYESTVYPGTTESICIPILEKQSQLISGKDFHVGYSPERINPGDREYTFKNIPKVISGQSKYTLEKIYDIYDNVLNAQIYKAPSIKVAEAAKLVENIQRDVNIALMNELSIIFKKLNINTTEVINAAKTKWNFLPFSPGLVGGHCIGIDPYYLIYKSTLEGYQPTFISSAREINDFIPSFIIQSLLQLIVTEQMQPKDLLVTVLGVTFKEDVPDMRNSKALHIVQELQQLGVDVQVHDPYVTNEQLKETTVKSWDELKKSDVVIVAVSHETYKNKSKGEWQSLFKHKKGIMMDLKHVVPKNTFKENIKMWRL